MLYNIRKERGTAIMNANINMGKMKNFSAPKKDRFIRKANRMSKKIINFNKLHEYSQLEYNWNDNGAEPFDKELINLAWKKINELEIQPKVFPTAGDSIQFEYEKGNGDYLEFQICEDKIEVFKIIDKNEEEFNTSIDDDINNIVNKFHGK